MAENGASNNNGPDSMYRHLKVEDALAYLERVKKQVNAEISTKCVVLRSIM